MKVCYRKLAIAGFFVILLFTYLFLPAKKASYAQNSGANSSEKEIIVVFKNRPTVSLLSALSSNTTQNLEIKNGIAASNAMVFNVTSGDVKTAMVELSRDPNVKAVFPNYKLSLQALPNDPQVVAAPAAGLPRQQWNLFNLKLAGTERSAWDVTTGSANIVVAIVDSGINSTHPEFAGKISSLVDCSTSSCTEVTSMTDNHPAGHGTHVAGLVGAATNNNEGIAGAGYNTKLMILRVMASDGSTTTDNFLNAIKWATDHGAKIINTSFGVVVDSLVPAAITEYNDTVAYAWERGVVVVAAAGNCGGSTNGLKGCEIHPNGEPTVSGYAQNSKLYPAASPNVISVAATTWNDALASYSEHNDAANANIGNWISVAAPGGDGNCTDSTKTCIFSTVPTNQYFWQSGTSMASPQVAAVAALVWAAKPSLTNEQVKNIIETTANHSIPAGTNNGLVNALSAVEAAAGTNNTTPTPTPSGSISVTPSPTVTGNPTPTVTGNLTPTITPTAGPTATPTITPYPTVAPRLPKTGEIPTSGGPFCPVQITYAQPVKPVPTGPDCCTQNLLDQGYKCIQDCGPPVAQVGDVPPGYSCLSPDQQVSRERFGCPICLASNTVIDTPAGKAPVKDLKEGMSVWTVNKSGQKVAAPIIKTSSVSVSSSHKVNHLVLADGRSLWVSPGHPAAGGKLISELKASDRYDGSVIVSNDLQTYWDSKTYDILPAGDTGYYWANGILVGSTLFSGNNTEKSSSILNLIIKPAYAQNPWEPCCEGGQVGCRTYDPSSGWRGVCSHFQLSECGVLSMTTQSWSNCSALCGGGTQTCTQRDYCGNTSSCGSRSCNTQACATSTPTPTLTPTPTITPGSPTLTPTSTPIFTPTPTLPSTVTGTPSPRIPTIIPASCARKFEGDANCDGAVNESDFKLWSEQYDTLVYSMPPNQSANFTCVEGNTQTYFVDLTDFEAWRRNTTSGLFTPIISGTPAITPGGPTLTPSPTITPGGPTLTPTPTRSPNNPPPPPPPPGTSGGCNGDGDCGVGQCCIHGGGGNVCKPNNSPECTYRGGSSGYGNCGRDADCPAGQTCSGSPLTCHATVGDKTLPGDKDSSPPPPPPPPPGPGGPGNITICDSVGQCGTATEVCDSVGQCGLVSTIPNGSEQPPPGPGNITICDSVGQCGTATEVCDSAGQCGLSSGTEVCDSAGQCGLSPNSIMFFGKFSHLKYIKYIK